MPRRNLLWLIAITLVSLLCYQRVQRNPYGRVLGDAISKIERRYLEPIESLDLFEGAMDGMLGQLDDYSAYVRPADLPAFHESIDQQFPGVGMEVGLDPETRQLTVLSPLVGSPAYVAGIRAGDRLLRIDGSATQGMSLKDAVGLLRGEPGSAVTLTIQHEGDEKAIEVRIVRDIIQAPTVVGDTRNADGSWNFFLEGHDRIGYVRINSFVDKTVSDLQQALEWLQEREMRGLMLDLRDDPGGLLSSTVDVCDLFIDSGVIVTTRRRDGQISETYEASGNGPFTDFPIAVLVNNHTASAAEIVAACLQDHHRAVVVGQRSFGKGTVQEVMDLENGCGAMKLTTAGYWRPSGKNIHRLRNAGDKDEWGVRPDEGCEVVLDATELAKWRLWRQQRDIYKPNGAPKPAEPFVDRQLMRAVEYVEKTAGSG
jgi:carboxyl-terminal processing protease